MTNHRTRLRTALALALTATAFAQTAPKPVPPPDDETIKLEAFSVTGSNIRRLDIEKSLQIGRAHV